MLNLSKIVSGNFTLGHSTSQMVFSFVPSWHLGRCTQIFWGHNADVNSVNFHPNGMNFVTCSEDKTSRLWDIRSGINIVLSKECSYCKLHIILPDCISY